VNDSNDAIPPAGGPTPFARKDAVTGKDAFIADLNAFREDCGNPPSNKLAKLSRSLPRLYADAHGAERDLPCLSSTAICEILAGKRRRLPSADWVASFVLCCQRWAADIGARPDDPGTRSLPAWQARLRAAQSASGGTSRSGAALSPPPPNRAPVRLPLQHQLFVTSHGPYGDVLLTGVEAGHPEAVYRVALLLGTDPARVEDAHSLLVRAATTGHKPSLDLMDENPHGFLPPPAAARRAHSLAQEAEAAGSPAEALAFYQAAARGRVPDAAVKHAAAVLEKRGESEAAAWLEALANLADGASSSSSPDT
jgi:hypothetical protein